MDVPQTNGQRRGSLDGVRKERWARKERSKTRDKHEAVAGKVKSRATGEARVDVPRFEQHVLCRTGKARQGKIERMAYGYPITAGRHSATAIRRRSMPLAHRSSPEPI